MAVIDTTRHSLTLVKQFSYRGAPEEWSNTYFFTGALPASPSSWKTLADAVILEEKATFTSSTEVVRAIGHQAGQSVAVWSFDYLGASAAVPGTYVPTNVTQKTPGDSAAWVRWSTDQLTSKGKPIYLRSYYHDIYSAAEGSGLTFDHDLLETAQGTALQEYGADWIAGFADGDAVNHTRCGPKGAVGLVALASTYITTRTLERRGKRP